MFNIGIHKFLVVCTFALNVGVISSPCSNPTITTLAECCVDPKCTWNSNSGGGSGQCTSAHGGRRLNINCDNFNPTTSSSTSTTTTSSSTSTTTTSSSTSTTTTSSSTSTTTTSSSTSTTTTSSSTSTTSSSTSATKISPTTALTTTYATTHTLTTTPTYCQYAPTIVNQYSIGYNASGPPYPSQTTAKYICLSTYEIGNVTEMICINGSWANPFPVCNSPPVALVVVKAVMSMSCTFLVVALSIILAANLMISFIFMLIEALQSLYMLHNIISFGGITSKPRLCNAVFGWIIGIVPTAITAGCYYDSYPSFNSCWVNLDANVSIGIITPILIVFLLTVILTEAAAMGDFPQLPLTNKNQLIAAHVNQKSMMPIICLSIASWFIGLWASYNATAYLFSLAATVNIAFGVVIIVFHFFGNKKINNWFHKKIWDRCCNHQNTVGGA